MAPPRSSIAIAEFPGFSGGAQLLTDAYKLESHQARRLENLILDELGTANGRLGCALLGTVGAAGDRVLSRHVFQRAGLTTQVLVHLSDGTIRYSNSPFSSWTTIWSGLSTTAPFSFVTFTDHVYMSNGTNDYRRWDGTTGDTYPSVPKFKYLIEWADGLWGGGEAANPHRLNLLDPKQE